MHIPAQLSEATPNYSTEIVGVITTLCAVFLIWLSTRLWNRFCDDKVVLRAKFENSGSLEHIETYGCTGLVLTIINRGRRAVKIKLAHISAQHVDMLEFIQQGFDQNFGYTPAKGAPPPELLIELLPLAQRTSESGWYLERDDAVKFFLPILAPPVLMFPSLPSEDLRVLVTQANDEEIELLRGPKVQEPIRLLEKSWGERLAEQKLNAVVNYKVNVSSSTLPIMDAVGHVNCRTINLPDAISSNPLAIHRRRS